MPKDRLSWNKDQLLEQIHRFYNVVRVLRAGLSTLLSAIFNLQIPNRNSEQLRQKFWYEQVFLAGCTGGIVKAVVACPIELSKVRLQITVSKLKTRTAGRVRVNRIHFVR